MSTNAFKQAVAQAALPYIKSDTIIGVGTGSTVNFLIDALATIRPKIKGAVASSEATALRLQAHGIPVHDLNSIEHLSVYIDGADEITSAGLMIKGGGAALTREKIVASVAQTFICIADHTKLVQKLGVFPLPLEIIPMGQAAISRAVQRLGGTARLRLQANEKPLVTDNGGWVLDVSGLDLTDSPAMETTLNNLAGVITVGLFAHRAADIALLGGSEGVKQWIF